MARRSIERHTDPYNPAPKAFQVNLPHKRQGGFRGDSPWGRHLHDGWIGSCALLIGALVSSLLLQFHRLSDLLFRLLHGLLTLLQLLLLDRGGSCRGAHCVGAATGEQGEGEQGSAVCGGLLRVHRWVPPICVPSLPCCAHRFIQQLHIWASRRLARCSTRSLSFPLQRASAATGERPYLARGSKP